MASKNRRARRKECGHKQRYQERHQAEGAARAVSKRKGETLGFYLCRWCHFWHVGHTPYRIRRATELRASMHHGTR